jgi:hypothetical protein
MVIRSDVLCLFGVFFFNQREQILSCRTLSFSSFLAFAIATGAAAQSQSQKPVESMAGMDMSSDSEGEMAHMHEGFSSGTAWQPLAVPEHMWMVNKGPWMLMAHGNLFVTFNHQGGPRGVGKLESMNWLMFMEQRPFAGGHLIFRQMVSADALTVPHGGFPELFQTGETYHGQPLVDHQHPHDVFGELALLYTRGISDRVTWMFYGGPAGEPALGPVAYVHRASAAELPAAPLSHHLQDSTHISYGVVTTGLVLNLPRLGSWKAEGSVFNGREPDERRQTIDLNPLSSWSVRVAANPSRNWSAQYSYGHLVQPEAATPGDINRQTATIGYTRTFADGNWSSSLLWGRNRKLAERSTQNGYGLESLVNFARVNYAYTRLELVDKDELFPKLPLPRPSFRIGAYTFGGVRDFVHNEKWNIGVGADFTVYSKPGALDAVYGKNPVSFQVYLRVRPGEMKH